MQDRINFSSVLKGVGSDFASLGIVLIIVFILTIIMGIVYVSLYIARDFLVIAGVFASIAMIPIIIGIGLFLNLYLFRKIPEDGRGSWRLFRVKEIALDIYSREYRSLYIVQRLSFLVIMVFLFVFMLFSTGILNIIPYMCCILAPISLPMILITVTLPAMAWIAFSYALDPYQPEPRAMIIIGVFWGILSTFPSLFMNTFNSLWMDDAGLSVAVISAPVFEELFKSLGFILIFSQIKDETDGIIYGATFGAGFSLMENILYGGQAVMTGGGIVFIILVGFRSFFNIVGHMIGPSIIGFLIGWNKRVIIPRLKKNQTFPGVISTLMATFLMIISILFGYIISVLGHGTWNYLAGFGLSWPFLLMMLFGLFQMFFFVSMAILGYYLATKRYNRKLKRFLQNKKNPAVLLSRMR